jgi:hypothetical protein
MNLYNIFEGLTKKTNEDFNGLPYGMETESNGLAGSLADGNGVSATLGTDNDISPIGSGEYEDDEHVTEDNPYELDEAAMNPSAFAKAIEGGAAKGVLVGFEFETLIPKATVMAWKNGPVTAPVGYDASSLAWIEGKTTNDLLDGILRAMPNNSNRNEKIIDDLFKYKSSVQSTVGHKSIWSHYRQWVDQQVRQELEAEAASGVNPVVAALKDLLKDRAFGNTVVGWMGGDEARRYGTDAEGNEVQVKAKPFILRVLKDKTGVDFSGRVKKSELTPEVILKIKDAMQFIYRITRGPVDNRCSAVSNAADGRRDELYRKYVPGWSYSHQTTPETTAEFKNHFAQFCTATMGTDNLKELLKNKWAFKGRVNNTTDTLKEKLWYYVTPGAAEPASLQTRSRSSSTDYMDGAEFLKANLKDVYGDNMEIFRGYHQATKKLDRWYIEPDGSLRPNQGDYAAEVVSPPLKADAAMAALRTWYQKAQQLNLYTNNSTGLHINVSIPDKIDVLKLAVFSGDQYVLKQFGREDNSYARSVIKSLKNQGNLPTIGSDTFKNAEKQMKELVGRISGDHFATVNFNGKYVSFRHAGGNYLGAAEAIANTVGRFVRAMMIAADPSAYRDEYVGKLVKMMKTPEGPAGDKLAITDIREIATRGIPVQYVDFVTTVGSNPAEAVAAAEEWSRANYGANKVNTKVIPDPSARERLAADRGFSALTKQHIETTAPENFFRLEIFPTTRRSLESFVNRFSNYGTDRGTAFGMYSNNRDKRAVGVTALATVKQTDPGFVDAVKALRGESSKPLPLPGTKAAPKAKAAKFASQQSAAQQPAQAAQQYGIWHTRDNQWVENGNGLIAYDNPYAVREYMNTHNLTSGNYEMRPIPSSQAQPSSDDESEPAGGQQWELYHIPSGDIVTQGTRPVTFTADRLSHAQDAMATWMRERGMTGNGYSVRPVSEEESTYNLLGTDGDVLQHYHGTLADTRRVAQSVADRIEDTVYILDNGRHVETIRPNSSSEDDEESGTDARDTYRFVNADTGRVLDTEQGLSEESALERAEELVRQYNVEVVVYDYRDQEVERINPDELDDDNDDNARETWTLNNGEMVRHYDPSQVNSERAFELAREFYSQYGHPVTISRDGVTYGHWPRQDQGQRYTLDTNTAQRIVVAQGAEDVRQHALSMANELGETVRVLNAEGEVVATVAPAQRQETESGSQFYRFMNPSNRNTVGTGHYATDQEAEAHAQRIANAVHGEILLLGVSAIGPDRRLGTFQPQVSEARIFHPHEKVNVVYQPHNSKSSVIVAKAVDHIMANRVIDSYVHRNQQNPNRAPLSAKDFILNPITYQTIEAQDGMGVTGAGGSIANDSTSPVGGGGVSEDEMMESYLYSMKRAGYDIL